MNGIYIHVPFCRKACRYCDFYFTVSLKYKDAYLKVLHAELSADKAFPAPGTVNSVYFGGGTPSVLSIAEISGILDTIRAKYCLSEDVEISLEANPDDLLPEYIRGLKLAGINRLSIGIQSFDNQLLDLMRRSHGADKAFSSIQDCLAAGISNLNCDLIYGVPGLSSTVWKQSLDRLFSLPVNHLSAYHLTFEPGTVFDHWRKKGRLQVPEEEESLLQYKILQEKAVQYDFEQYEISNFARERQYSKHNLLYWTGGFYQGFGPAAHSYDGESRRWNKPSLLAYIDEDRSESISETEVLTVHERYHDYLITAFRTKWGADPNFILEQFGTVYYEWFMEKVKPFISSGQLVEEGSKMKMTGNSWFVADHILRALFMD